MKLILICLSVLFSFEGHAQHGHDHGHGHSHGDGHDHGHDHGRREIKKQRTGVIGRIHVERLVQEKKIDKSWKRSDFEKSVLKDGEWLVTFVNKEGVKGKKLYIFLKKTGEFIAANFTGK